MVRGIMTQHVMEAVSREMFSGAQGRQLVDEMLRSSTRLDVRRRSSSCCCDMLIVGAELLRQRAGGAGRRRGGLTMPYDVHEEAVDRRHQRAYNGYAHSFAGMGIQFLLFAAIDLGVGMLLERQRGLWKRLRSAPVSRATLLGGKAASGTLIIAR